MLLALATMDIAHWIYGCGRIPWLIPDQTKFGYLVAEFFRELESGLVAQFRNYTDRAYEIEKLTKHTYIRHQRATAVVVIVYVANWCFFHERVGLRGS